MFCCESFKGFKAIVSFVSHWLCLSEQLKKMLTKTCVVAASCREMAGIHANVPRAPLFCSFALMARSAASFLLSHLPLNRLASYQSDKVCCCSYRGLGGGFHSLSLLLRHEMWFVCPPKAVQWCFLSFPTLSPSPSHVSALPLSSSWLPADAVTNAVGSLLCIVVPLPLLRKYCGLWAERQKTLGWADEEEWERSREARWVVIWRWWNWWKERNKISVLFVEVNE